MVFNSRRFVTLCLFHLHRQVHPLAYEGGTDTVFRNVGTCLWRWNRQCSGKSALVYEDGTDTVFRNVGTCLWRWNRHSFPKRRHLPMKIDQTQCSENAGEQPKSLHTTYRTRRKLEIKNRLAPSRKTRSDHQIVHPVAFSLFLLLSYLEDGVLLKIGSPSPI
jgi:hypothetical protein